MANLNKVFLMGNLTRDPQLSYTPSQTPVCELGLAVNRRWTAQDGQQKEEVTYVDCTSYGKQAETLSKYMKKGRPLFVEGRLKLDQWEAQDGSKRSKMRVVIEGFQFLGGPDSRSGDAAEGGSDSGSGQRFQPRSAPPAGRPAAPHADDQPPPISDDDIPF